MQTELMKQEDNQMTYKEMVERLKVSSRYIQKDGLRIKIKPIPDNDREGMLDIRVKKDMERSAGLSYPKDNYHMSLEELKILRSEMGTNNIEVTGGAVHIENSKIVGENGNKIPVCIYKSEKSVGKEPVLIYIHGGGFLAGHLGMCDNLCRGIAYQSSAAVVSVDYRLSPENKYPAGLQDCYSVLEWVYENAEELSIDKKRIVICGDSAGGNLAAACTLRNYNEKKEKIKLQILLYPVLNPGKIEEAVKWNREEYVTKDNLDIQNRCIQDVGIFGDLIAATYVEEPEDLKKPYVSPIFVNHMEHFPKTLIVTAEYDYLRLEGEQYAKKLLQAGNEVSMIRYNGVTHAFAEHLGYYPQAEDCLNEITEALGKVLS